MAQAHNRLPAHKSAEQPPGPLPQKMLLGRADLKALGIPGTNVTLLRNEQRGRFPRRLRVGGTMVCWDRDEIMQWLEARRAERAHHHYADYG